MNNLLVYLPKPDYLNEATSFYIDMVCEGLSGKKPEIVYRLSELNTCTAVLVIDARSFLFVKLRYPWLRVITWYQGILPEEALMVFDSKIRFFYWSFFEFISLHLSSINIFVSAAMRHHFAMKYKYKDKKNIIIPCFNKKNNDKIILDDRGFSFVYAGSLHKWQCIDKMLSIFLCIQQKEPIATLAFYTFNINEAEKIISKYNLKNVNIKKVGLDEIDKEISKCRYGFLIRDDHVVNNVATPTKMNTYLSVGTKPVLTDVVVDFREHIDKDACVYIHPHDSNEQVAELIIEDYKNKKTDIAFSTARDKVFTDYFNRDGYMKKLRDINL